MCSPYGCPLENRYFRVMPASEVLALIAGIVFVVSIFRPETILFSVGGLLLAAALIVPHLH